MRAPGTKEWDRYSMWVRVWLLDNGAHSPMVPTGFAGLGVQSPIVPTGFAGLGVQSPIVLTGFAGLGESDPIVVPTVRLCPRVLRAWGNPIR